MHHVMLTTLQREQVLLLDRFNGSYINMTHLTAMRYDDTLLSQGNIYVRPGLCEQYEVQQPSSFLWG
jgi:hypothetical protein